MYQLRYPFPKDPPGAASLTRAAIVVGVGRHRFGDDSAGLWVASALRARLGNLARVICDDSGGWKILTEADASGLLVIVDAAQAGGAFPAGEWRRLEYTRQRDALAAVPLRAVHSAGVVSLLQLAECLGYLPAETWIYAIAGERFAPEEPLSPAVAASLETVSRVIEADVRSWCACRVATSR